MTRTFYIVPHTHWDREWYQPFQVFRSRLVEIVDELLEIVEGDDRFAHFLLDGQTAVPADYLEVRPENRPRLEKAVATGRFSTGPFHILMDEFLVSGETIVRNLARGTALAEKMGGCSPVAYLPDMFGHISQMPQILARAGYEDAVVWRGVPSAIDRTLFRWESPDGSSVRAAYLATSYSNGAYLPTEPDALKERLEFLARELDAYSAEGRYLIMNGTDHAPPQRRLPEAVERTAAAFGEGTRIRICSLADYLADLPKEPVQSWKGELRSGARVNLLMGVVSNRVDIRRMAAEIEDRLSRYGEPLAALYAPRIPRRYFEIAWDLLIQNSAHDSVCACSIDDVTHQVWTRYLEARQIVDTTTARCMEALAAHAEETCSEEGATGTRRRVTDATTPRSYAYPGVVVFNPSLSPRGGPAELTVPLYGTREELVLVDERGGSRPVQFLSESDPEVLIDQLFPPALLRAYLAAISSREVMGYFINEIVLDESAPTPLVTILVDTVAVGELDIDAEKERLLAFLERTSAESVQIVARRPAEARLLAEVPEVPPLGWGAFPIVAGKAEFSEERYRLRHDSTSVENRHLRVELAEDGTFAVHHLASSTAYEGLSYLVDGGEWGDTYNYSPPPGDELVTRPDHVEIAPLYGGPLGAGFRILRRYSIPSHVDPKHKKRATQGRVDLVVEQTVELWADEPFVRLTTRFENRARDHRLRLHFPLPFEPLGSFGAGAFDVVARGLQAEGGSHEVGLPTFPARGFVDAWGYLESRPSSLAGLAVIAGPVFEYEVVGRELAVTLLRATGMLSRPDHGLRPAGAGPSIPTHASQCLGPHTWRMAVMPHMGSWAEAGVHEAAERFVFQMATDETRPLTAAATGERLGVAARNCFVSALIPDEAGPVLRIWAPEGGGELSLDVEAEEVSILGRPLGEGRGQRFSRREAIPVAPYEIKTLRLSIS